ncbi:MAG: tetratricopeptide repeat protein [Gemmataceae bacterium]|nr:tetratricopeptide repeat protein [Gemmataceae bacterium]
MPENHGYPPRLIGKSVRCKFCKSVLKTSEEPLQADALETLADSHDRLGDIAADEGNLAAAREHFQKALEIRRKLAEEYATHSDLWHLGIAHYRLGNIEKALENLAAPCLL